MKYLVKTSYKILWSFPFSRFKWIRQLAPALRIIEILHNLTAQHYATCYRST